MTDTAAHPDPAPQAPTASFADLTCAAALRVPLEAGDRDGAIAELLRSLCDGGCVPADHHDRLLTAILDRERSGSTGFGKGVAVPHVKTDAIDAPVAAVGVRPDGLDFNALDHRPVRCVVLLVSPVGEPQQHLTAMELIFNHLQDDSFRELLSTATDPAEARALLKRGIAADVADATEA